MFYVSTISGHLTPFEPAITPLSIAPLSVAPSAAIAPASPVVNTAPLESSNLSGSSALSDEAAVFEKALATPRYDLTGTNNSTNIGRGGASIAYRTQALTKPAQSAPLEVETTTRPVEEIDALTEHTIRSRRQVPPVDRERYRDPPPSRARKEVTVASDIMTAPVFTLPESALLNEARAVFAHRKFRHIPILSEQRKLVGILSDRNFIDRLPDEATSPKQIRTLMVTNILTARPETPIRDIAQVMITHHIGCLPILNDAGDLTGILTRSDILRAIVNHAPIEMWG